ncbi:MAG: HTH-type transcriptional regulator CysB [Gammaproteobacteria bacterium]|nr:MAG: HTH-type transcriptional regulator CysB [Gammaproteobacteria bacterium]
MKLQQLKYIYEVSKHDLNVSATAESLFTSQPGISKQIRLLEDELGIQIFVRSGKHLTTITPPGKLILNIAEQILNQAGQISTIAKEFSNHKEGKLSIATTNTQARYDLPSIIESYNQVYPKVILQMHQGSPAQIAEFAIKGEVDFAVATEPFDSNDLVMLPCYRWNRCILVPKGHELTKRNTVALDELANHPLITYVKGFAERTELDRVFQEAKLAPSIVFAATDADVIKTYVRLGMGVAVISSMAYDPILDADLVMMDARNLFQDDIAYIGFTRTLYFRQYMYDFIESLAPHLTTELIQQAQATKNNDAVVKLLQDIELPFR